MKKHLDTRITLSLLWIVLMINMIFNDIFSIFVELVNKDTMDIPMEIKMAMFIAGIVTNIPIMMIIFSYVLKPKINRILNIIAAVFTIVYVVGGGSLVPHYILVAAIEVILAVIIIVIAAKWKSDQV